MISMTIRYKRTIAEIARIIGSGSGTNPKIVPRDVSAIPHATMTAPHAASFTL